MNIATVAGELWQALANDNMFAVSTILRSTEIWFILAPVFAAFVAVTVAILRFVPFIDRNFERWLMIILYIVMTAIIFGEVIRRTSATLGIPGIGDIQSWAGSSTVPAWIFLVLTWLGASYSIKRRTQLNFSELRSVMPRFWQIAMLGLDWVLWTSFAYIIFVVGIQRTVNSSNNFQIVPGTDDMMQWWYYAAIPVCWVLLAARAWIVFGDDRVNYRTGKPMLEQVSMTETEA
ncbi:MAG: TRAP transporter small permease subunit [Pseudomonadota bacterium]